MASAGTIFDKNTSLSNPARNTNTATESICPRGWNLPTTKQIDSNRDITNFAPIKGGYYTGGSLVQEDMYGFWWGSEALNPIERYRLGYSSGGLGTATGGRYTGRYIRCVSEEKTVTDLTYMQDMTPSIANWTPSTLADAEAFI